jgi:hypothetical protein
MKKVAALFFVLMVSAGLVFAQQTGGSKSAAGSKGDPRERETSAASAAESQGEAADGAETASSSGAGKSAKKSSQKASEKFGSHSKGEFNIVLMTDYTAIVGMKPVWGNLKRKYTYHGINPVGGLAEYYFLRWLSVSGGLSLKVEYLNREQDDRDTWREVHQNAGGLDLAVTIPIGIHFNIFKIFYMGFGFDFTFPVYFFIEGYARYIPQGNNTTPEYIEKGDENTDPWVHNTDKYVRITLDLGVDLTRNGRGSRILFKMGGSPALRSNYWVSPDTFQIGIGYQYVF